MAELTTAAFEAAQARSDKRLRSPRAENAHYDADRNRVIVQLSTGIEVGILPSMVEGLADATAADLAQIEVEAFGLGLHFPGVDADPLHPGSAGGHPGGQRQPGSG